MNARLRWLDGQSTQNATFGFSDRNTRQSQEQCKTNCILVELLDMQYYKVYEAKGQNSAVAV
jgi:hypothetical protein